MAKRKATRPRKAARAGRKAAKSRAAVKRPTRRARSSRRTSTPKPARRKTVRPRATVRKKKSAPRKAARKATRTTSAVAARRRRPTKTPVRTPRLDRARRTLDDVPTPPSSLDMTRQGSAARTGRAEFNENLEEHRGMTGLTGGDVDADWENAYFSGDEAPGGDNPTPDQDVVEEAGRSLGVEYQDNEELRSSDKVTDRDKHRWELDPASSEDYKDRK